MSPHIAHLWRMDRSAPSRYQRRMIAKGTFEIQMTPEPPYSTADGITLARVRIVKQFAGDLVGASTVDMMGARTPVSGSAGYVAIERVIGTLAGREGTFVLQHSGVMTRGKQELTVTVVPDSATGELVGLSGRLAIDIVEGKHFYTFEYELGA